MTCTHHWVIATPDGRAMLPATCRHCGATRVYAAAEDPDVQTAIALSLPTSRTTAADARARLEHQKRRAKVLCADCGRRFRPMNLGRHRQARHAEVMA